MTNFFLAQAANCVASCSSSSGASQAECIRLCNYGGATFGGINNPALGHLNVNTGVSFFQQLIPSLIGLAFVVGVVIFLFMLILAAIRWISSGGDKASVESARSQLTQALIGIVVLFSVFAIIKLIETFFGISILTLDIGSLIIK